jgi:hypothetical protein
MNVQTKVMRFGGREIQKVSGDPKRAEVEIYEQNDQKCNVQGEEVQKSEPIIQILNAKKPIPITKNQRNKKKQNLCFFWWAPP